MDKYTEILEIRRKYKGLYDEATAIRDKAAAEKRAMTADEEKAFNAKLDEAATLLKKIEQEEKLLAAGQPLNTPAPQGVRTDPGIGMPDSDVKRYSLVRAIRAAATGNWRGAELELEASQAVAKKVGKEAHSFFVPYDYLHERRDLVIGTPSAGGYLKATDLLAASFIEMLTNKMVVQQAGALVLSGLVGDITIPKQSGGATAYWVAENAAPTESQQTLAQVPLIPKSVGAWTDISRKLLLQSSIDVEAFVRGDLALTLALALDKASLHGSGTGNEPTGVEKQTGVAIVAIGANGGAMTWAHAVQLETEVAQDNADIGALSYITNAKARGKLKQTEKASTTGMFIWGDRSPEMNGYRGLVTNQVRSDLTKGTSGAVCSAVFFGNWRDLIIGLWGGLDMLVDPYTGGTAGTVRVIAFQDCDIAVRHPESFSAVLDFLTT